MRLVPIWGVLLIFAVIFQQPATFFTNQGMTMQRSSGTSSTKFIIPPATLQSSITISIILLMPFYDTILIPMSRFVTRSEKGISVMQRMGIGMFLSVIAMMVAALVEEKMLEILQQNGTNSVGPNQK
ncbi:Protein NRT1/ PTR FAMILY 5.8 [Linum grandiflorum]